MTGAVRLLEVILSGLGLLSDKLPGVGSLKDLGKFISAVFDSSKGELCVKDHSKPPPGLSIISLSLAWHCVSVLPIANIIESSTKPGDNLSSDEATSINGAL